MLTAAAYFANDFADECEKSVRWPTNCTGASTGSGPRMAGATVAHGWKPESGFLLHRWQGYDEALVPLRAWPGLANLPVTRKAIPPGPPPIDGRRSTTRSCCIPARSLPTRSPTCGLTFGGSKTRTCAARTSITLKTAAGQLTCSSNTPSTTRANSRLTAKTAGDTACDGPGWVSLRIKVEERHFFDYVARGVPDGPDDGTIAPWAVVASLPFAPEIVLPALRHFDDLNLRVTNPYGYKATFNPTFPEESADSPFWVSPWHVGLNQGPIVLMIEHYCSDLVWRLMRECPYLVDGLRRAGFSGGWLESGRPADRLTSGRVPARTSRSSIDDLLRYDLSAPICRPTGSEGT